MPRTNDPLGILTGAGFAPPGSVSSSSIAPGEVGPASESLDAHVDNPTGAHPATAISILDPYTRYFMGPNVEGALNELAALVPPPMGGVGSEGVAWLGSTNSGVPDWGILKLWDGILPFTGNPAADPHAVYPYYYRAPVTASGYGLTGAGVEPATDPTFNVLDGVYTGGGDGTTHAGFVTLTMGAGAAGYPTWRMLTAIANPAAVVSGIVSPADRGVLALVKWPTGTEPDPAPAASVADIQARCVAAILLGKGILDNGCDGEPGGVFVEATGGERALASVKYLANPAAGYTYTLDLSSVGGPAAPVTFTAVAGVPANPYEFQVGGALAATAENFALALNNLYYSEVLAAIPNAGTVDIYLRAPGTVGNSPTTTISCTAAPGDIGVVDFSGGTDAILSPYTFPGRAAGQYNLDEVHKGLSTTTGDDPFFNPAAGQVRLLTDPAAVTFAPATVLGGLPIFGATASAIGTATALPGFPFSIGGGTNSNFFAYRLPYLKDYSAASGLIYTPATEKPRFTTPIVPAAVVTLDPAGAYENFTTDFWAYQIARYRHRFELTPPPALAITRTDGNYALVHFKKEAYFEAYVRDGVVPTSDQLWSVNLVQWTGNTPPYDLVENLVTDTPSVSTANPMNRSEVVEDKNGAFAPAPFGLSFTLGTAAGPTKMYCSGIEYYVPIDVTTVSTPNIAITDLSFTYPSVFDRGYRSHDTVPVAGPLSTDDRKYALNQNPVFVSLASFSYEGDEALGTSTIATGSPGVTTFPAELGSIRRQRIEFGYADLTLAATADPAPADVASYNFAVAPYTKGIYFTGDPNYPVFTTDAKVRVFLRRPMVVDLATGYPEPITGTTVPNSSVDTILYHSMQEGTATATVPYGNPNNPALRGLTNTKDRDERFLDEVYRYPEDWAPLAAPDATQLQGPGLPFGPAPISVPVRPVAGGGYDGWYLGGYNANALTTGGPDPNLNNGLQVAGLPPRDPSYKEGLTSPAPYRGLLVYPQTNYSAGYAPAQALGPASDYSVLTGDRVYVRAFDAGAGNAGTSTVTFRLWGVDITDFQYAALTAPGATGMAVMVKVPGLTTWMDAGRADGTGPSKQDIALDGAGCLVTYTTGTDTASQIFHTDITVSLSPAALFINGEGKCPVLVKVILKDNATGKALNFVGGGETAATSTLRGLVGIEINP